MVKALAVADPGRWLPNFVTTGRFGKLAVLTALGEQPPEDLTPGALALAANDRIRQLLDPYFPGDPWGMQDFSWWLLHRESPPEASLKELADELYLTEEFLTRALRLLADKGQVVFYGPPGRARPTSRASSLATSPAAATTSSKVQFHPSYAYEDFIEGYRPRLENGQVTYKVIDGPLKRMAEIARQHPDRTYVLLIGDRCMFVGDCKYKKTDDTIPNADAYQMLAYLTALQLTHGLLVYAAGEDVPHDISIPLAGKHILIRTIDISQAPNDILTQIADLADLIRSITARPTGGALPRRLAAGAEL